MSHVRGVAPVLAPKSHETVPEAGPVSRRGSRVGAAVLALALGGVLLFSLTWHPAPPLSAAGVASADVPLTLAGYVSDGDRPPDDYVKKALPGANILQRLYCQGAARMNFLLISGTQGVALHDPRLCMGSLLLSAPQTEHLPGTPVTMQVYKASSQPGALPDQLVSYFYVGNGKVISSPSEIRMSLFWGDLFGRTNAPVYFFRFIQPLNLTPTPACKRSPRRCGGHSARRWAPPRRLTPSMLSKFPIRKKLRCHDYDS